MRFARNIVLLLTVVVLLAGALVATRLLRPKAPLAVGDRLFPMAPEAVVGVDWDVLGPAGRRVSMVLRREGEFWRMTRPYVGALCDAAAVTDLLDAAQSMRVLARLGAAEDSSFRAERRLTLRTPDAASVCGFGEVLPMQLSQTLAELDGMLVSVEASAVSRLPVSASALRTRVVLPVAPERILSLEWRAPGQPFTRAQRMANGNWNVTQPFPFEAQAEQVAPALAALTDSRSIVAYVRPADEEALGLGDLVAPNLSSESGLAGYGLDEENAVRVSVHVRGLGEALTLRFGKPDPVREGNVFCLLDGYQAVVSVPAALMAVFGPKGPFATDYRNLPVLGDVETPARLTLRKSQTSVPVELVHARGVWSIVLPVSLPADAVALRALLGGLTTLTGDLMGTETPRDEPLLCEVSIVSDGSGAAVPCVLTFYGSPKAETLLAYRGDQGRLYRVRASAVPAVLRDGGFEHALVDRTVLSVPAASIRRIAMLRRDGTQTAVVRPGAALAWETERPKGAYIDAAVLDAWLTGFADLKALRVLRDAPTVFGALRPYGLEHPLLRLTLDLEGGDEGLRRVLLVGDPDPVTGAAPALVQGRPILYEISAGTLELLRRTPVKAEDPLK